MLNKNFRDMLSAFSVAGVEYLVIDPRGFFFPLQLAGIISRSVNDGR